ncbi:hypothetical protein [Salinispora mooreana]|uniref:hypothetical protein n=1 Tax=Salinispora mooreana TaxID=999545 RepID=UPI00036A7719|nr:hypothetical protein [Salinispora mooreana]
MTTPTQRGATATSSSAKAPKKTMSFTAAAESAAKRVKDHFNLPDALDAGRLGLAYALREKLPVERPADFGALSGTLYNIGSVDPEGELRDLLLALRPELSEDPYRVIETLLNIGTISLDNQIATAAVLSLRDLLNEPQ